MAASIARVRLLTCAVRGAELCRYLCPSNILHSKTVQHGLMNSKSCVHTSGLCKGLMEFFDTKKNWEELSISVGRSWEKADLRSRSNQDLHKLWYVLLKEMNMLLTMKAEYDRLCESMPNPERLEKVEVSLDNLRDVIDERDRSYALLETGELPHPRWIDDVDELGRPVRRLEEEHLVPKELNEEHQNKYKHTGAYQHKFKVLFAEQEADRAGYHHKRARRLFYKLMKKYPQLHKDEQFVMEYCLQKTVPVNFNPDVEKLMAESDQK